MHCDFAFFIGGTRENTKDLPELERLPGCAGVKVFMGSSTGSLLVEDDEGVRNILKVIRRRASFHSEDEYRLNERKNLRVEGDPRSHPVWRDEIAALQCTQRLVRLARETGKRVHVLHISTAQEMDFLKDHKDVASVEATPHHLTLEAPDCYERLGALRADESAGARPRAQGGDLARHPAGHRRRARLRPRAAHRGGEGEGLSGDALRHDRRADAGPDHARPRQCRPAVARPRFVDLTSAGPARLFGIAGKGRIAVGYDADLTVVDLKRRETITNRWIASRAGWTPYDGVTVTGWPVGTFVRGSQVMWEGELTAPSRRRGGALPRNDAGRLKSARIRRATILRRVISVFHSVEPGLRLA